jgi:hypothetical protein
MIGSTYNESNYKEIDIEPNDLTDFRPLPSYVQGKKDLQHIGPKR